MANSIENSKAIEAWKRQPEINTFMAKRDDLQKQLDKILDGKFIDASEKQAQALYDQIASLNDDWHQNEQSEERSGCLNRGAFL